MLTLALALPCYFPCPMVIGWGVSLPGYYLGSFVSLAIRLVRLGCVRLLALLILRIFCILLCVLVSLQDVLFAGAKLFGYFLGAEALPWLGRELVPLWPLPEQGGGGSSHHLLGVSIQ